MERDTLEHSAVWRTLERTRRHLVAVAEGSLFLPVGGRPPLLYETLARSRAVTALGSLWNATANTAEGWVRGSGLFRWLTSEPDPDVITIDLGESRIVGPPVRVFLRTVARSRRHWRGSRLRVAVDRLRRAVGRLPWDWIRGSSVCRFLAAVFAPPPSSRPEREGAGTGTGTETDTGARPEAGAEGERFPDGGGGGSDGGTDAGGNASREDRGLE